MHWYWLCGIINGLRRNKGYGGQYLLVEGERNDNVCSFVPVFDYVDVLRERERWCYCVLPPPIVPGVSLLYRYRIGWLFIYSCKQRHLTKNETTKRERRRESERDDIQSDIIRIHSRKRRHRGREMIKAKAWITSNILPYPKKNVEHLHFHSYTPGITNENEKYTMVVEGENERRKQSVYTVTTRIRYTIGRGG